jgi:hypothetical protein
VTLRRAVVTIVAAAMLAVVIVRYPPGPGLSFDPGMFLAFDLTKARPVLRGLLGLLVLNLAAYGLGRPLRERLGGLGHGLATLEALALGFLVLADVVLLLAALRLLQPAVLGTLLLALASVGCSYAWRDRPASWPRPGWLWLAGGALLVSPLLGAWVPDYGWDGFAYHLAVPERYLFRNRIVLTPLFPHSAFPHTVEMLYLLAVAFDPGALAKLLNLELGVLVAGAAFVLASRGSRRAGLLAMAILAADPLFNWELGVAYNDLAASLFALLAGAALLEHQAAGDTKALVRCGIFAGACLATRYPGGVVLLALLLVAAFARIPWRLRLRRVLVIGGLATLVFSPWMARNLVMTGNPVAPVLQGVFHAPGHEFFDPAALAQEVTYTRNVGMGRGWDKLLLLPFNITLRPRMGFYDAFGFRLGPLYVVAVLACLLFAAARATPAARLFLKLAAILTLLWFYTFQEPRYLLPALGLLAVAGGIGLDHWLPTKLGRGAVLWLLPAVALLHTQWEAALLLPYRYGYALGGLSVEGFEAQEPALAAAAPLRRLLGPGDRLLLVYESRGYFYRGMDYVLVKWAEVLRLIHEDREPAAFRRRLEAMGVTHLLINTNNMSRYRDWIAPVPGWSAEELDEDLRRLRAFVDQETTPVLSDRGVFVRKLRPAASGHSSATGP